MSEQEQPANELPPIAPGPRYYDEALNPEQRYIPGVPLGDLSADDFAELPERLQRSVDALPFYTTTLPIRPVEEDSDGRDSL